MTDVYPLHDLGLLALEQKASLHAELLAEYGPEEAVIAAIEEDDEDEQGTGIDNAFRRSGPQARFAGAAFNATFPQANDPDFRSDTLFVHTDETGLYGF